MKDPKNWLRGSTTSDYREQVLNSMKIAKNRYERSRKEESKDKNKSDILADLDIKYRNLVEGKDTSSHIKKSIVDIDEDLDIRRTFMKNSSCMGSNLKRYFELTSDEKFVYYKNLNDNKPRKKFDINPCKCEIETKRDMTDKELKSWKEKDQTKLYRLKITVPKGKDKKRDVFYYTSDIFEAEYLKLEIESDKTIAFNEDIRTVNKIFTASAVSNIIKSSDIEPMRVAKVEKVEVEKPKVKQRAPTIKWQFDHTQLQHLTKDGKS